MNPFLRHPEAYKRTPIRAEQPAVKETDTGVTLRLYDPIDSWGDVWGLSAKEFVAAVDAIPADAGEIRLLINSPGGEVWDGLAILNALRSHPARVVAVVEGIAASAASFIAAGADELVMMANAEVFVHRAWGITIGNANDMAKMADDLTHEDRNIASIYAAKAGGTVDDWLAAMDGETWYSAQEAVDAGLADSVQDPASGQGGAAEAKNRFDLSTLTHRASAAASVRATHMPPAEPEEQKNNPNPEEGFDMASDQFMAGLRDRLGISADADLDEGGVLSALDEVLAEHADSKEERSVPEGAVLLDQGAYDDLQAAAREGREARQRQIADDRERAVAAAVNDGRIPPARRQHWLDQLTADPGAVEVLDSLPKNTVPIEAAGFTGGVDESSDDDRLYSKVWGDDEKKGA